MPTEEAERDNVMHPQLTPTDGLVLVASDPPAGRFVDIPENRKNGA